MKKWLKKHALTIILAVTVILTISFTVAGCVEYINDAGQKVTALNPEVADTLDKAAELAPVVQDTLLGVSVAFPALAGLFGIISGVVGAGAASYRKYRNGIFAEQDNTLVYANTTKAIVYAIEQFKGSNIEDWDNLKGNLKEELLDKVGPEALTIIETLIQEYRDEL